MVNRLTPYRGHGGGLGGDLEKGEDEGEKRRDGGGGAGKACFPD